MIEKGRVMADESSATPDAEMTTTERMLRDQIRCLERIAQYLGEQELRRVVSSIADSSRLEHWGRKIYSQSDEDGILGEILRRIGARPDDGILIEFGVENGLQSNTHWLLRQGYTVVWLEYNDRHVKWIRRFFADYLSDGRLQLAHELVARDTVDSRLAALAAGRPVSVLSIDVDGNDYWLWERVEGIRPAVVVVEYNATWPPPLSVVQEHDTEGPKKVKTDYWGASLSALHTLARRKGYQLVGCGIVGVNAFFVRDDLATQQLFPYPWTPDALYHPLRRKLIADAFVPGFPPAVGRYEVI
jgi:predicted O-methyltransferase YrrM